MTTIETYLDGNIDGIPSDYSEILFNALDKCKASGIITSITKPINIIPGCYNLRLELKNEATQYSLYGIGNNPSCHAKLGYNLSGDNFPKVGDYLSSIAEISTNYIIKIGDEAYNGNLSLPDCPYYYEDIIGGIVYDDIETSHINSNKGEIEGDIKTYEGSKNSNTSSITDGTNIIKETSSNISVPKQTTPSIVIKEEATPESFATGIENLESFGNIQESNIEYNSGSLTQSEIEESIENIFYTNYYFLGFFIFIIITGILFIKLYKKK